MAEDEFVGYIKAQCAAILRFRIEECERRGCAHPERCEKYGCDNQRNGAAFRWCQAGRAAAFRVTWADRKVRIERSEGHNSET